VAKGWFLTAFKIVKEAQEQRASATAVRMSFTTDTPFFPYREPASQRDPKKAAPEQRLLRVYVLAATRMEGRLGNDGHWPGRTVWSGAMPKEEDKFLLYTLKVHDKVKGKDWRLTEIEDDSSPRPGTDEIYFASAADQSNVARPPMVRHLYHFEQVHDPFETYTAVLAGVVLGAVLFGLVYFLVTLWLRPRSTA
jgi:hypothetical protein